MISAAEWLLACAKHFALPHKNYIGFRLHARLDLVDYWHFCTYHQCFPTVGGGGGGGVGGAGCGNSYGKKTILKNWGQILYLC